MRSSLIAAVVLAGVVFSAEEEVTRASVTQIVSAESLANPAAAGSAQPNLTVDLQGRVVLSWLEPTNAGRAFQLAVHDGARWSPTRTIAARSDFIANWADFPSVEVLDGGRFAAHWLQRDGLGTSYGIRVVQSADTGRTWSAPIAPHRDSAKTEYGFVAMWREPGRVGIAWLDGRKLTKSHDTSNEMMLVSTTILPDGSMGPETRLDERTCDCCQNAAAMTAKGPVVVYRDRSQQEIRDIYITRRVGGAWTRGAAVHNDNWKIAACPVNGPAIAAKDNRVAVAWFTGAGDSARVKLAFSDDAGATFAAPIRIDGGLPAGRVDVELLADGAALVTWIERTGGDTASVQARRVSRDGRAGAPVVVAASSAARASGFPRTVIAKNHAVFAWTQPGRPSTIRMARIPLASLR